MDNHGTSVLEEADRVIYERQAVHGTPENSFGLISEFWSDYLKEEVSPIDVANMMILLKIARGSRGRENIDDYIDIAGYSENAGQLLKVEEND